MGAVRKILKKGSAIGELGFIKGGGKINWFPGHMATATRAIRDRLKLSDFVIEVRDARVTTPNSTLHLNFSLIVLFIEPIDLSRAWFPLICKLHFFFFSFCLSRFELINYVAEAVIRVVYVSSNETVRLNLGFFRFLE